MWESGSENNISLNCVLRAPLGYRFHGRAVTRGKFGVEAGFREAGSFLICS